MVSQIADLNSWVLNQDWGKQQQKLVYRALLRSDGSLWEEAEFSIIPCVSALVRETWLSQEPRTKFFPKTRLPSFPPQLWESLRMLLRNQALFSQQPPPSSSTPPQCSTAQCFCTLSRHSQGNCKIRAIHTNIHMHFPITVSPKWDQFSFV